MYPFLNETVRYSDQFVSLYREYYIIIDSISYIFARLSHSEGDFAITPMYFILNLPKGEYM